MESLEIVAATFDRLGGPERERVLDTLELAGLDVLASGHWRGSPTPAPAMRPILDPGGESPDIRAAYHRALVRPCAVDDESDPRH